MIRATCNLFNKFDSKHTRAILFIKNKEKKKKRVDTESKVLKHLCECELQTGVGGANSERKLHHTAAINFMS